MTSLLVSIMLVVTQKLHGHLSFDSQFGVQKLHSAPTPRIGGIAVAMALGLGCVLLRGEAFDFWWMWAVAALPAFAAGLTEDLTKKVGVRMRLAATLLSGLLFCLL
ncbi:MAG: glycosyl transferase family 4, partial [Rhodobacteraceae bacterium]|nr:glycosyl transferase family 4 [Paracoccaceae bacterium]